MLRSLSFLKVHNNSARITAQAQPLNHIVNFSVLIKIGDGEVKRSDRDQILQNLKNRENFLILENLTVPSVVS